VRDFERKQRNSVSTFESLLNTCYYSFKKEGVTAYTLFPTSAETPYHAVITEIPVRIGKLRSTLVQEDLGTSE
jgi:subtilase family serine protease